MIFKLQISIPQTNQFLRTVVTKRYNGVLLSLLGVIAWMVIGYTGFIDIARPDQNEGELSAMLSKQTARIGDIVWLTLRYRLKGEVSPQNNPKLSGIEKLTILDQIVEPDQIRIKFLVDRLESWQSGILTISFEDKQGVIQTLTADPVSFKVSSVLGDRPAEAQLRPIQDIIPITGGWSSYGPWAIGLAGLVVILSSVYIWYNRRYNRKIPFAPDDPPHISARKSLEALERRQIFEKGEVKEFYFIFSEIMRHYLESIRHFPAAEYTTEEISHHIQNTQDRKLLMLLKKSDLVKFADTVPTPAGKEEDVRLALSYIDETGPVSDDKENVSERRHIEGGGR